MDWTTSIFFGTQQVSVLEPATLLLRRMPRLCPPAPEGAHVQAFDDPAEYLEHR